MSNLETLKKQAADLEAKLEESTAKLKEMKAEIERLENGWEMKYPYEFGDGYFHITSDGRIKLDFWEDHRMDKKRFNVGNIFPTEEAALLEAKRRNLLTRFRAFRDECNGEWKADWNTNDAKWSISKNEDGLSDVCTISLDIFATFGYFKNQADCERAIELFGNEIKELFVDGE